MVFFPEPANSPTLQPSTGCPTIQLNSDTNYPELAQTPQVKGSFPKDFPHFRHQLQVSPGHPTPDEPVTNWEFSRLPAQVQ